MKGQVQGLHKWNPSPPGLCYLPTVKTEAEDHVKSVYTETTFSAWVTRSVPLSLLLDIAESRHQDEKECAQQNSRRSVF
jgi:hypothetical protein